MLTAGEFLFQKRLSLRGFFYWPLHDFSQAKAIQNNFREFEELVFFALWISDSGFSFLDSGFLIPDSGFQVLGLPFFARCFLRCALTN